MTWVITLLSLFLQTASPVVVVFETDLGRFEVAVDVAHAPVSGGNFLKYVDDGAYNGGYFHRTVRPDTEVDTVNPIQVVQASPARGSRSYAPIPLERTSVTGLSNVAGSLAYARAGVDSATSDIFISVTDNTALDFAGKRNADGQGFAVFGAVVSGMDVIKNIQAAPTQPNATGRAKQSLQPRINITKAYRK